VGNESTTRTDLVSLDELAARLKTQFDRGLDAADATRRLEAGRNELPVAARTPTLVRIWRQVREPMSLLLLTAAVVSFAVLREPVDAIAITAIVIINILIAVVQEERAATALEALRSAAAPTASVIRSGRSLVIPSAELVEGDVVLLAAGDLVPADLWLLDGWSLEANESLVTGESLAVAKYSVPEGNMTLPAAERTWMTYAGTLITAGSGRGLVIATGPATEVGRIAGHLSSESAPTPLQKKLGRLTARLGQAAVGVATAVFALIFLRLGNSPDAVEQAFLAAVALAVAAVPEGLPTVVTLSLALGVKRMAHQGAIVRNLPAVETLGSTTVLLTDKTGTLTQNRLQLSSIIPNEGAPLSPAELSGEMARAISHIAVLCNDASVDPAQGDPIEVALLEPFAPEEIHRLRATHPRIANLPFDSRRKMMSTLHKSDHGLELYTKGAPEQVLAVTDRLLLNDGSQRVADADDRAALVARVNQLAGEGGRVLALAQRTHETQPQDLEASEQDLTLVALAVMHDPLRPETESTVARMIRAGVDLVMVTGDHAGTASNVAQAAGLTHGDHEIMTGSEIRTQGLPADPHSIRVYARVDPDQKLALVEAFQKAGHVVAVTGDGVNDAPALRRADIGVAMGKTGSQVAREAADLVITDDDLNLVTKAVREGRAIFDNIRKVVDYLVAGNLSEVLVVLTGLAFFPELGIPLFPLQLLWINLLTDGLPALAFGFDRHRQDLLYRPAGSTAGQLLSARRLVMLGGRAVVIGGGAIAALAEIRSAGGTWEEARTVMFTALVIGHLLHAYVVRLPLRTHRANPRLFVAVSLGLVLQVAVVLGPWRDVFGVVALDPIAWAVAAVAGVAPVGILAVLVALGSGPQPIAERRSAPGPDRLTFS
jgi:Ca2+-transporting ATPase